MPVPIDMALVGKIIGRGGETIRRLSEESGARLQIEREKYQARCPKGEKNTNFRKARLEKFAPYSREDGLVRQTTEAQP